MPKDGELKEEFALRIDMESGENKEPSRSKENLANLTGDSKIDGRTLKKFLPFCFGRYSEKNPLCVICQSVKLVVDQFGVIPTKELCKKLREEESKRPARSISELIGLYFK